jgi:hypothetical protein
MTCGHLFSQPGRALRLLPAAGTGVLLTAALGLGPASAPAGAADPPRQVPDTLLRLCDASGCYIAWRVVDSDHDGVSDADELVAGTDPYDANSRPPMDVIARLGEEHRLPSFEAGLGTFQLFPTEIVEMLSQAHPDLLAAFPMNERKDALTRLGISSEQMAAAGVDPARSGLTVGLDRPASGQVGEFPGRRLGSMDVRLISNGDAGTTGRTWVIPGSDGSKTTWTDLGGGHYQGVKTNADGSPGTTRDVSSHTREYSDGSAEQTTSETVSQDGKLLSQTTTVTTGGKGQASSTTTTTTTYLRDANGKVTGQRHTRKTTSTSADGSSTFEVTEEEDCDVNGNGCVPTPGDPEHDDGDDGGGGDHHDDGDDGSGGVHHDDGDGGDHGHVDPEQAEQYVITPEMVDGALRMRGAAVTVVQGWTPPGEDEPDNPYDDGTIVLIDPDQAMTFTVLNAPRVTTAQPERRSDLPDPLQAAPPPHGSSDGSCQSRLCFSG